MPKQKGVIKLDGSIDDITFYHTRDGYIAKAKSSLNAARIAKDPAFARTRENGQEFGSAAESGKTMRHTVASLMKTAKDTRITSRLTETMSQILKLDLTSKRGSRTVAVAVTDPTVLALFKGFEFNNKAIMSTVMTAPYTVDTVTGIITIPNLVPLNSVNAPPGSTHVTLKGAYANVNFANNVTSIDYTNIVNLLIDATSTTVKLTPTGVPPGTGSKFYFLQIEFFQLVNGLQYELNAGSSNSLVIAEAA